MASIKFKIWRYLIKSKFSNKYIDSEIDIQKARRFDTALPPNKIRKRISIDNRKFLDRDVFYIKSEKRKNNSKIILYFHGGAFISGITRPHWYLVEKLSSFLGYNIILPDYPLAPETNYIDTTNFALELYKDLLKNSDPSQIQIIGDSAGGNLTVTLALMLGKNKISQPERIILLSPWLDLSLCNHEIKNLEKYDIMLSIKKLRTASKLYSNNTDIKNPLISPIYGDLKTLPETHLFISNHDLLFADSKKFRDLVKASGVKIDFYEYDKMMHVWMLFPIPEGLEVVKQINKIIDG
jgi:monoterpene epsilon-lactone hydrolase